MDPFLDLDAFIDLPRLNGLWLSPDGRRLVVGAATPDRAKNRFTTALWEIDPDGARATRRLTRSDEGESGAGFTPSGDLLFVSSRPGPGGSEGRRALWRQPAGGGDTHVIANPAGKVRGVVVATDGTVVFGSTMLPSATGPGNDEELRNARKDAGVTAILHEEYPIRNWDHDLGPARTRLLVSAVDDPSRLRDLTGHVGRALGAETSWDLSPDGRTVVATWIVAEPGGSERSTLVAIDVATGDRRVLADEDDREYGSPKVSPDGTSVAVTVRLRSTPDGPGAQWLGLVPVAGGPVTPLTAAWDRWPRSPRWLPDSSALVVVADDRGRAPLWRVDATTGEPTRLTHDDAAYSDVAVAGSTVYALRSAIDSPPLPVRITADAVHALRVDSLALPGRLEEVTATAADGTPLRAWLAVPHVASADAPAPLVVQIHGGPVRSQNSWSWRWNPWLLVARGYAVLQHDFALSTGYGIDFVRRGWNRWGAEPYTDLMTMTDAAGERPDIDTAHAAAIGGSFGGYLANWIAGHTDRFAAIVSHASVWTLDSANATADYAYKFRREMPSAVAEAHSPHFSLDSVTTPMLVIHGDEDYRVPIGEALRLWWDLSSQPAGLPHKFLYFPDEGHWILKPGNIRTWYATVLAFLDHHVRGLPWRRPDSLG